MIGATWLWTILCFAASFFSSWFLFAIVWYIVAYAHGEEGNYDDNNIHSGLALEADSIVDLKLN